MPAQEGVTKFDLQFTSSAPLPFDELRALNAWRTIFHRLDLIGRDPLRYGGVGFGNVSGRLAPFDGPAPRFAITGTQTGHLPVLDERHYAVVLATDPVRNRVVAQGPVPPSSESLTHGMLYKLDDEIRYVFHVHCPEIWRNAHALGIPVTDPSVAYGTPAMAAEIKRLFKAAGVGEQKVFAMGGHEDGVIAFGCSAQCAGTIIVRCLADALWRR
ncbi:MAG: class II aldolase/adducin family protein [Gammaproteobacteria bacterium]|nr:class II aldolase/adducin family protein [Gammaproteobacteria bacterium]